ncbi:MAG: SH3 domain-containing protein [Candidatus Dormiibacterota bacterium]
MPARARRLTRGGFPATAASVLAAGATVLLAACAGVPSSPSRTPPATPTIATTATPSPTPLIVGSTRTVLSPLGLRVHSTPVLGSTNVIGGFSQGRSFTVLEYQSGGGGWFRVHGRTLAGWVVADPTLTAAGTFNLFSQADGVSALYPQSWGFQVETIGALFVPQSGTSESAVLNTGTSLKSFGAPGLLGYVPTSSAPVVVCGYTGTLAYYTKNASYSGPTNAPIPVPRQPLYAEIRLSMDSTHAMLIGFNYQDSSQLDVYSALYNSVAFPFPRCEAPAKATPAP